MLKSFCITDYLFDYNISTEIKNIQYGKLENINLFTKKICFYNSEIIIPLQKFLFLIINSKIIKKENTIVTIIFSSKQLKLIESIQNLDYITTKIMKKKFNIKKKIIFSIDILNNFPPKMILELDKNFIYFDIKNNKNNIKLNTLIQIYIQFDSIMFYNNKYYRKWKVIQIKEIETIDSKKNLFIINNDIINNTIINEKENVIEKKNDNVILEKNKILDTLKYKNYSKPQINLSEIKIIKDKLKNINIL